jgi:hypothetical protein
MGTPPEIDLAIEAIGFLSLSLTVRRTAAPLFAWRHALMILIASSSSVWATTRIRPMMTGGPSRT